jgi:hypothetical protein
MTINACKTTLEIHATESLINKRSYDASIHWKRFSPLLNEWFDISVFKIDVKVL